ncbi:hypothetical protein ACOMHN_028307 [Nucella lapillus]
MSTAMAEMSTTQRRGSVTTEGLAGATLRRASVPQHGGAAAGQPSTGRRGSKITFLGAGRRVSMLLKYKQAIKGRTKDALPEDGEEEEEENPMKAIRELPQNPRFSTFMSPEAQYAMMKGYEDKLYERISGSNPVATHSLQRSKTPSQKKISIVDQEEDGGEEEEVVEGSRGSPEVKSTSTVATTTSSKTIPTTTRRLSVSMALSDGTSPSLDRSSSTTTPPGMVTISVPYLKPLRRLSVAVTSRAYHANGNGGMMVPMEDPLESHNIQRSQSLSTLDPPGGLSLNKRLVLTHRLQSAMDMLDGLKEKDSELSLSPRLVRGKNRQGGDVVKNFNSWSQVWNKEFKEIQPN